MVSRKHIALTASATAVAVAGIIGVGAASAATTSTSKRTSLASEIASKFNLSQGDVQGVINQHRSESAAQRETDYEARLTKAVSDGKLTVAQKDTVLTEHKQLQTELTAAMAKTGDDRKTAVKAVMDEAKAWAKQQNIEAHWLLGDHRLRG